MFSKEIFAVRLKALRLAAALSQEELGEKVALSKQAINDMEKCRRLTTLDKAYALADYFEISLDYLVGRSDEREKR